MNTEHWCELRITDHPKKMSETLADYARPLTDQLPPNHTAEELKAMLTVAACVWNAVDIDVYWDGTELRAKAIGLGPNPDFWNPKREREPQWCHRSYPIRGAAQS